MRKQTSSGGASAVTMQNDQEEENISGPRAKGPQILDMPPFWATAILLLWASRKLYRAYVPMP